MHELIEYIAKWIVDDPEVVRVEERQRGERVIVRLEVAEEDMGRVIGKEGRIANAMRALLDISAEVRGGDASLEIR